VEAVERARARAEALQQWWHDVHAELVRLPTTLQHLREGAANFQVVGQRLADSSSALEELTALYGKTLRQSVRRSADAADALKSQIDRMSDGPMTPDAVASAAAELQKSFESLAAMNPFWPTSARRGRRRE
jgi:hypothetical protein